MKWPVDIIEKIAKRKVVLFLGAGVSANAISEKGDKRPPTWEQFLNKGISEVTDENIVEYVRKLLNEKDYLTACEVLVNQIGNERFERIAREEFLTPKYKSYRIHENILKLDSKIVITPNVDKIYEVYAQAETDDLPVTLATQMEKIIHDAVPSGEALCGASQVIYVQRSAE